MNDELTPEPTPPAAVPTPPDVDDGGASPAGPATEPPPHAGPATAGSLIRDARQAQGIDLASLAAMLKIPLRRLEALEADQHDELQGPTFERALAQAACRVLKIDPKPVLALLPQHARNTLEGVTEGINTPFRDGQGGGFELPAIVRPVGVIVIVLILAAIALFVVPDGWLARVTRPLMNGLAASAPGEGGAASAPAAVATTLVPAQVASEVVPSPVVASGPVSVSVSPSAMPAPAAASAVLPAAVAPAPPASPGVDEVLAHVAPAPNIPLQVVAAADSWVEVVDAHGRTLLSRTVVAGESVGLDGAMPMRIKVGNASGTRLKLRGDNVDLTPWTRDNVARLEVK
ncbi:MAG: helix-turn-helix domain-containing protein [Burkholderiaceae bacterium]